MSATREGPREGAREDAHEDAQGKAREGVHAAREDDIASTGFAITEYLLDICLHHHNPITTKLRLISEFCKRDTFKQNKNSTLRDGTPIILALLQGLSTSETPRWEVFRKVVNLLVKKHIGVDVDAHDDDGRRALTLALHLAQLEGWDLMQMDDNPVEVLLSSGASVELMENDFAAAPELLNNTQLIELASEVSRRAAEARNKVRPRHWDLLLSLETQSLSDEEEENGLEELSETQNIDEDTSDLGPWYSEVYVPGELRPTIRYVKNE